MRHRSGAAGSRMESRQRGGRRIEPAAFVAQSGQWSTSARNDGRGGRDRTGPPRCARWAGSGGLPLRGAHGAPEPPRWSPVRSLVSESQARYSRFTLLKSGVMNRAFLRQLRKELSPGRVPRRRRLPRMVRRVIDVSDGRSRPLLPCPGRVGHRIRPHAGGATTSTASTGTSTGTSGESSCGATLPTARVTPDHPVRDGTVDFIGGKP